MAEVPVNKLPYAMPYANRFEESFILLITQVRILQDILFLLLSISASLHFLGTESPEMSVFWPGGPGEQLASLEADVIGAAFPTARK